MMNDPLIRIMLQRKWWQNTDKIAHYRHIYINKLSRSEDYGEPSQNKKIGSSSYKNISIFPEKKCPKS